MIQLKDTLIQADTLDLLSVLKAELAERGINRFNNIKENGSNIQTNCPFHKGGQERKPSFGINGEKDKCHCFRGDTKVITYEYGTVEIASLVGKKVHILNGNGEWEQTEFYNYGKQRLMKMSITSNGNTKEIFATDEHQWLVKGKTTKIFTKDLKPNYYLEKVTPKKSSVTLSNAGIMHGFCYGDGSITRKYKHSFTNRCFFYNDIDNEIIKYFDSEIYKARAGNGKEYPCTVFTSYRNLKNVPELNEDISYLAGFLAGYFVADGNCFDGRCSISSYNYEDLYKVQQICTKLGIASYSIGVSNIPEGQRGCVYVKRPTKCYTLRLVYNTIPNNIFISSKGRNQNVRYSRLRYKVKSVEYTDIIEDVFCCQTSTHSFALEDFILTGNCFTCGWSGSIEKMVSEILGHNDNGEYGKRWIVRRFDSTEIEHRNIKLNFSRTKTSSITQDYVQEDELDKYRYYHPYWEERKITSNELIELFDLGYDKETDCITMPVRDKDGHTLFVARRSVKTKFFQYPQGVEKPLYGLFEIYNCNDEIKTLSGLPSDCSEIIVCESMIDALTCWQYGKYAVALNGLGTDFQFKQLSELPCRKIILATDNDERGLNARPRIRRNVKGKIITEVQFPKDKKDINELSKEEFYNLEQIF